MAKTDERKAAKLSPAAPEPGESMSAGTIGALVVLGLLVLFLLQNFQTAEIRFLWFTWSMSVTWALLGAAVAGAVVSIAVGTLRRRRHRTAA